LFQNWQSEFLSIGMLVVLSIFLRQKGSPESNLSMRRIRKHEKANVILRRIDSMQMNSSYCETD